MAPWRCRCAASRLLHSRLTPRRVIDNATTAPDAIAASADHRGRIPTPSPAFAISIIASVSMMNDTRAGARPAGASTA